MQNNGSEAHEVIHQTSLTISSYGTVYIMSHRHDASFSAENNIFIAV